MLVGKWDGGAAELGHLLVQVDVEGGQVHGRGADEACDEDVVRVIVELTRGAYLLQDAEVQDGDAVAHGEGFRLVVGDVQRGYAHAALQVRDLGTGLHTQLRVQVGQWLVHKEDLWLAHDGAAHSHALALTTGQCLRLAVEVLGQVEGLRGLFHSLVDLGLVHAGDLQREAHVLAHGHVRVQGVVLEDHRDVAVLRADVGDVAVADADVAFIGVLETGEHAQRGRLTGAGRADEDEELPVRDFKVEFVDTRCGRTRVDARCVVVSY